MFLVFWLNSSFDPICFKKLRFWPSNKVKYKTAPFAVLAPQANFDQVKADVDITCVFLIKKKIN